MILSTFGSKVCIRVFLSPKLCGSNFFSFRYLRMGLKTLPVIFFENPFMLPTCSNNIFEKVQKYVFVVKNKYHLKCHTFYISLRINTRVFLSPQIRRSNFFFSKYLRMGLKTPPVNFFENPFMLTTCSNGFFEKVKKYLFWQKYASNHKNSRVDL